MNCVILAVLKKAFGHWIVLIQCAFDRYSVATAGSELEFFTPCGNRLPLGSPKIVVGL